MPGHPKQPGAIHAFEILPAAHPQKNLLDSVLGSFPIAPEKPLRKSGQGSLILTQERGHTGGAFLGGRARGTV